MKDKSLRVLMVEDSEDDALLIIRELKKGGYVPVYERVETAAAMKKALKKKQWDIILCNYNLLKFNSPSAMALLKETNIDIPLIVVTGKIGEETAAECMRLGAKDYIMKDNLSRLCPAIARELEDAKVRNKQKQMEEALRKSALDWQDTFEATSDSICLLDADQRILRCNFNMSKMFEVTREEIIGRHCWDIVHGSTEPIPECPTARMKNSLVRETMDIQRGDRWFSITADPILDETRTIQGVVHIVRDITERKQAEESLKEAELKFRTIFDHASDGILLLNIKHGKFSAANEKLCNMLGYTKEELLNLGIPDIHPQDFVPFVIDQTEKQLKKEILVAENIPVMRKDKTVFFADISSSPLSLGGDEYLLGIFRDITERKRAETELLKTTTMLESLLDAIPDVIGVQDMGHGIIRYNAAGYALLGQTPEGIAGKKCFEIIGHENPCDICATSETYRTKRPARKEKFVPELGTWLEVRSYPVLDANGEIRFVIEHLRDISELKKAEEALRRGEEHYRTIFENTGTSMIVVEEDMTISMANGEFLRNTGYSADEINGRMKWTEIVHQDDLGRMIEQHLLRRMSQESALPSYEFRYITKTGDVRDAFLTIQVVPGTKKSIASLIDITDRKKSENLLRASEDKFFNIFNLSPVLIAISDLQDGTYIDINDNFLNVLGYDRREVVGKSSEELGIIVESQKRSEALEILLKDGLFLDYEIPIRKKNGKICIGLFSGTVINLQGRQVLLTIMNDITERQLAESQKEAALDALRKSEDKYRTLIETTDTGYVIIDQDGLVRDANPEYVRLTGHHDLSEIIGRSVLEWTAKSENEKNAEAMKACFEKGYIRNLEINYEDAKGNLTPIEINATCINLEGKRHTITICRDITERKKAEKTIKKSEKKYRNIFENATEGIYQATTEGRFIAANAALARMAGYDSPEELIESIKDIGSQLYVNPEDRKRFLEIRTKKGFINGFEVEFYRKNRSKFWVVINARVVKDEQGEILYSEGIIEDITLRKHSEEQLHKSLDSLKRAVGTTIHVLASAVESRDPYTAGHQSRSADLACAIATEMGLAPEKIEGIRMAGIIHDIGKLSIPAEILSKPIKLTEIEFALIKEHSRSGYEMLKDVESPWPLAEIVYQHHERMNGSGYPRNLKGDEIIIESQILAVADVVEAMASHRPYRPTLGIDAALEEITKNKGILYDNAVIDACLKLFREKNYQLR